MAMTTATATALATNGSVQPPETATTTTTTALPVTMEDQAMEMTMLWIDIREKQLHLKSLVAALLEEEKRRGRDEAATMTMTTPGPVTIERLGAILADAEALDGLLSHGEDAMQRLFTVLRAPPPPTPTPTPPPPSAAPSKLAPTDGLVSGAVTTTTIPKMPTTTEAGSARALDAYLGGDDDPTAMTPGGEGIVHSIYQHWDRERHLSDRAIIAPPLPAGELSGLALHDFFAEQLRSRRRLSNSGSSALVPLPQGNGGHHDPTAAATSAAPTSAALLPSSQHRPKKRGRPKSVKPPNGDVRLGSAPYANGGTDNATGRRPRGRPPTAVGPRMANGVPAREVLDRREAPDGAPEYLIRFEGDDAPVWIGRRRCSQQAKALIAAFNRRKLRATYRAAERAARQQELREAAAAGREDHVDGAATAATAAADGDGEDNDGIYNVDRIVTDRLRWGRKEYWVRWEGYDSSENTWERADKLRREVPEVVDAYERAKALRRPSPSTATTTTESRLDGGRRSASMGETAAPAPPVTSMATAAAAKPTEPRSRPRGRPRTRPRALEIVSPDDVSSDESSSDGY